MKKILLIVFSLLFCSSVFAAPLSQLVFFGDSLTDDGNIFRLLKFVPPSPYFYGHFSNGYTWAENVGKYFYDKHYTSEANYAYGGATAVLRDSSTTTLELEQAAYYDDAAPEDISKTTFFIWIGANDYLHEVKENPDTLTDGVISKIAEGVGSLVAHGAKQIVVMNLPDLSMTPYARKNNLVARFHVVSELHNRKLAERVKQLQNQYAGIQLVNVHDILDDVLKNPGKYTLDNVTDDCLVDNNARYTSVNVSNLDNSLRQAMKNEKNTFVNVDGILKSTTLKDVYRLGKGYETGDVSLCNDPNKHLFWDAIHPSAVAHHILAEMIEQQLESAK